MVHKDRGHYAKKHPSHLKLDPGIAEEVKLRAQSGEMSCAVAHSIAKHLKTEPREVGFTIDFLEIAIVKCQLGLYGYRPRKRIVKTADRISQGLEEAIREAVIDGRLPCKDAWDIAQRLSIGKMEVSSACEALKIKISSCQLGAF